VLEQCFDVVKKEGMIVSITAVNCKEEASKHGINFIVRMDAKQLNSITKMVENGTIKPMIDATYLPISSARCGLPEAGPLKSLFLFL
jgi:hypothetical protein